MRAPILASACLAVCGMLGCTPAFNWREVQIAATPLQAMFPCKPEKESRSVAMAGVETVLHMAHCDTAGVSAAIGHARIADASLIQPALTQWRAATLAGMRIAPSAAGGSAGEWSWAPAGALSVDATGSAADGAPLRLKAAWFARDGEIYAALWWGRSWSAEMADSFFSGLHFR